MSPSYEASSRIIPPDYQERVLGVGSNGGGKSEFFRQLLAAGYPRWFAWDVKGDFDPLEDHKVMKDPRDGWAWRADRILYRPARQFRTPGWTKFVLARLLDRAMKAGPRRPSICYLDEAHYITRHGGRDGMMDLAVVGRSLGLGFWVGSQRPIWIPVEVRSEAWTWWVFYLAKKQDELEVLSYTKGKLSLEDLEAAWTNFSFWEIRRGRTSPADLQIIHRPPLVRKPHRGEKVA